MNQTILPSKTTDVSWIYALRKVGVYPQGDPQTNGKWLIFIHQRAIDQAWKKVKAATEEGLLGLSSKVSTAKSNPNSINSEDHVICVYTYDSDDYKDVSRIRSKLRELGFTISIPYKTDKATAEGKYRIKGDTKISKYFE